MLGEQVLPVARVGLARARVGIGHQSRVTQVREPARQVGVMLAHPEHVVQHEQPREGPLALRARQVAVDGEAISPEVDGFRVQVIGLFDGAGLVHASPRIRSYPMGA